MKIVEFRDGKVMQAIGRLYDRQNVWDGKFPVYFCLVTIGDSIRMVVSDIEVTPEQAKEHFTGASNASSR